MSEKKLWIGSHGPYLYDDSEAVQDPDGVVTEDQAGIVSEGKITALEGVSDSTGILRLKAQSEPDDPASGYGYFWMDLSYNVRFKATDGNGYSRSYRLFALPIDLSAADVSSNVEVSDLSITPIRQISPVDISAESYVTDVDIGIRQLRASDISVESYVTLEDIGFRQLRFSDISAESSVTNINIEVA